MNLSARIRSWWKGLAQRTRTEDELETELNFHMEVSAEELTRRGMSREEALRHLRLELGSSVTHKENWRSAVGLRLWDDLRADLRYAARQLRRSPAFTVTVLIVLALGIGVNAAMFSILDATLLRRLPYARSGELMSVTARDSKGAPAWTFFADIEVWQERTQTLASLGYYNVDRVYLKGSANEHWIDSPLVSSNIFAVLGVQPVMGRGFLPSEQIPGQGKVVVLGNVVWQNMFQSDPNIVGKQVSINDVPYTVIGVMPPHFAFPVNDVEPQIWRPIEITEKHHVRDFSPGTFQVIARIRKNLKPDQAAAELNTVQQGLTPLYKDFHEFAPAGIELTRYQDTLTKDARNALIALLAAVAVIWLIACANVGNLMLARGMARQREISVRGALGASRWRIGRQLFTESLVLSAVGAISGLALAQITLLIFSKTLSVKLKLPEHLTPNLPVLGALLGLTVLSALLFGLLPAWLSARTPLEQSLRQGASQSTASRKRHRLQKAMMIAEIGLSLVLLISCGLLLRTVFALRHVPLGFRTDHVLIVQPKLPRYKYRGQDANRAVYRPLLERVQHLNGVSSASLTTIVPLHKGFDTQLTLYVGHGEKSTAPPTRIDAKLKASSPELKDVLGFKMYQGRFFTPQDTNDSQLVVVVNRAFARLYSPDEDIIGKFHIGMNMDKDRQATIVGVMDDFHQSSIEGPPVPEIDFCANQMRPTDGFYQPVLQAHVELAIRTERDPEQIIPDVRRAMTDLNPDLKDSSFVTMDQVVEDAMGGQLLAAHLLELFAGAALLVALAGLYGLLTYLVTQRTPELGVRLALGAQRPDIIRMLLKQAFWLLAIGAAIGVTLAYVSSRLLAGFLYGVKPGDLWTLGAVTGLLLLCGLLAAYVPSRRASRIDPLQALRNS